MPIYVFTSETDQNAHQALSSNRWAFSNNKKPSSKNHMGYGDRFLIYSQESKKIFGGGVLDSKPKLDEKIINGIWNGTWYALVNLHVQKHSDSGIDGKYYFSNVPSSSEKKWHHRCVLNNNTAPSDYIDDDFKYIMDNL